MLDIAEHQYDGYISLKDIAERQNISKKYLEQIIPLLNNSGFLLASRGSQGGYKLSKAPDRYTVADILKITEGSLSPVACLDRSPDECIRSRSCAVLNVWKGLDKVINDYLEGITLQDILDRQKGFCSDDCVI